MDAADRGADFEGMKDSNTIKPGLCADGYILGRGVKLSPKVAVVTEGKAFKWLCVWRNKHWIFRRLATQKEWARAVAWMLANE